MTFIKKMLLSVKSSYLPALIFAALVFYGAFFPVRSADNNVFFHTTFVALSVLGILFFKIFRAYKTCFLLIVLLGTYLLLQSLKWQFGAQYQLTSAQLALFVLCPLNLVFLFCLPQRMLSASVRFDILCFLLAQGILLENFPAHWLVSLSPLILHLSWLIWSAVIAFMLLHLSLSGKLIDASFFFATLSVLGGFVYGEDSNALCLYFALAGLIVILSALSHLIYAYFRDETTGVYSRNSFYRQTAKRFPLKYALCVVCIDDYDRLCKIFKASEMKVLLQLIVSKMLKIGTKASFYRYAEDEFVLIFKNEDKKQALQYVEDFRRSVAGSEFVLSKNNVLKVTVSAGLSEKKRSDANVQAVLDRAREVLQKTYKFTQNITSVA